VKTLEHFDLLSFLENINRTTNIEDAFKIFTNACLFVGFEYVVYSLITPHDSIGYKAGHAIVGNYPSDWMAYYRQKNYEKIDPVIKHIKQKEGIFCWNDLAKYNLLKNPKEKTLMLQADEAGLHNGVGLSFKNYYGEIVGMGLASSCKNLDITSSKLNFISIIAKQFDTVFKNLALKQKNNHLPEYTLTERQKEILFWIAKDKKYGEIADILNISENTVLYHIKEIFKRLQVNSQIAAILTAIKFGLITP